MKNTNTNNQPEDQDNVKIVEIRYHGIDIVEFNVSEGKVVRRDRFGKKFEYSSLEEALQGIFSQRQHLPEIIVTWLKIDSITVVEGRVIVQRLANEGLESFRDIRLEEPFTTTEWLEALRHVPYEK